ncbi:hypothetical protein NUQ49_02650, partial [Glaesserella parasuis]|nr:hypothetical protein [Glaesserella parasuis]
MFCNRDNYYKGYSEGLAEGLSQKSSSFYPNVLNTCIAIATIAAAIFTYNNWQDARYISRLDSIIEAYYETFIPSIATDGISMDMYYTYKVAMKDIDINKVAKTTNFSMSFPSDIDFNKLKEQKEDFYTNEILINIKKTIPNSYKLIASLE